MQFDEPVPQALPDYRKLSEFRYRIRKFMASSELAARALGLEPKQHQLLVSIRGFAERGGPTVGYLAERLQIRHHTAVELIDRMTERRLVRRRQREHDRRQVAVDLTPEGAELLRVLAEHHTAELAGLAPTLVNDLRELLTKEV